MHTPWSYSLHHSLMSYQLCGNMLFITWCCLYFFHTHLVTIIQIACFAPINILIFQALLLSIWSSWLAYLVIARWHSRCLINHCHPCVVLFENPQGNDITGEFILKEASEKDLKTISVFKAPYQWNQGRFRLQLEHCWQALKARGFPRGHNWAKMWPPDSR